MPSALHPSPGRPRSGRAQAAAPDALMLFGATGDLALRMLYPSLYFLDASDLLPNGMRVIGAARSNLEQDAFLQMVRQALEARADGGVTEAAWARFSSRLAYVSFDASKPESFQALARALEGTERTIFYLSTSPGLFGPICTGLKAGGLAHAGSRMVVEKPIGRDPKSLPGGQRRAGRRPSARTVSSGSTTISARRRCRTCWRCASPTPCSSRCGTSRPSTTCRSP